MRIDREVLVNLLMLLLFIETFAPNIHFLIAIRRGSNYTATALFFSLFATSPDIK